MDQSEALHLRVVDCEQLDFVIPPSAADQAAAIATAMTPAPGAAVRLSPAMRERLEALRSDFAGSDGKHFEWLGLGSSAGEDVPEHARDAERRMLVVYAGLREMNPGVSVRELAARDWAEFTPVERRAISQAVRMLTRKLLALTRIAADRQ